MAKVSTKDGKEAKDLDRKKSQTEDVGGRR